MNTNDNKIIEIVDNENDRETPLTRSQQNNFPPKKRFSTRLNMINLSEEQNPYVLSFPLHDELFGKSFINSNQEPINSNEVFMIPIICLLFTTTWSSPCNLLAKDLKELYAESNQGVKTLEIIQITLEKELMPGEKNQEKKEDIRKEEEPKFKAFIADKPWVFYNYCDEHADKIKEAFNISFAPQLIVLNRDLSVITYNGRKELANEGPTVSERWLKIVKESNPNLYTNNNILRVHEEHMMNNNSNKKDVNINDNQK